MTRFIDATPTWESILPTIRMVIESTKQPIHREAMWSEIERMAKLADLYVASQRNPVVSTESNE